MKALLREIKNNRFGWLIVGITVVTAFVWVLSGRPYFDDFVYQRRIIPEISTNYWTFNTPFIENWSELLDTIKNHYIWVNGRLANLFFLTLQFVPVWVVKLICAFFMAFLALSFWYATGWKRVANNGLAVVYAVLFWAALQWSDSMQSSDFLMNYVPTSFFMIVLIREFVLTSEKPKGWAWFLLVLFSLWHEGFTIVFLAFMSVYCVKRNKTVLWVAAIILIAGLLLQLPSGTAEDRKSVV